MSADVFFCQVKSSWFQSRLFSCFWGFLKENYLQASNPLSWIMWKITFYLQQFFQLLLFISLRKAHTALLKYLWNVSAYFPYFAFVALGSASAVKCHKASRWMAPFMTTVKSKVGHKWPAQWAHCYVIRCVYRGRIGVITLSAHLHRFVLRSSGEIGLYCHSSLFSWSCDLKWRTHLPD